MPLGVHILDRMLHHLQQDFGQLEDAQRGRQPAGPAADWQRQMPGAHLFPMPPPLDPLPIPILPFGAHHHHHHHHLFHHPMGHAAVHHHIPHHHAHPVVPFHLHHHIYQHAVRQHSHRPQPTAFTVPPQHTMPAPHAAQVGVHAYAAPAPRAVPVGAQPVRAAPAPLVMRAGVPRAQAMPVPPAVPSRGMQHAPHAPIQRPPAGVPRKTTVAGPPPSHAVPTQVATGPNVATGGIPPAPVAFVPPALPAGVRPVLQAPVTPAPQATPAGTRLEHAGTEQPPPAGVIQGRAAPLHYAPMGQCWHAPCQQYPRMRRRHTMLL